MSGLKSFQSIICHIRFIGKKSELTDMRKNGLVPGVIYLKNNTNLSIKVSLISLKNIIDTDSSCKTRIFELQIDDKSYFTVIKDVQFNVLNDQPYHIDFMEVSAKDKIKIDVPVKVINKNLCPGVKTGGDVYIVNYNIALKCPVTNIPDFIAIDVANATVGMKFKIKDLIIPEDAIPLDSNLLVARVSGKRVIADVEKATEGVDGNAPTSTATTPDTKAKTDDKKPAKTDDKKPATKK